MTAVEDEFLEDDEIYDIALGGIAANGTITNNDRAFLSINDVSLVKDIVWTIDFEFVITTDVVSGSPITVTPLTT